MNYQDLRVAVRVYLRNEGLVRGTISLLALLQCAIEDVAFENSLKETNESQADSTTQL